MNIVAQRLSALTSHNVIKTFPSDQGEVTHALDKVSAQVRRGELTALVGPDGAGKTTFIRLAAGLMRADSGALTVLDIDVAAAPYEVQRKIGYMPQRFGLYEDLTVQENLDLYADLHGVSHERQNRYARLMEMTALHAFRDRLAGHLSGGMKQKLGLACTLIRSPELLLLDEPTVGVDPLSRRELWEMILQLVYDEGLTVLLSTSYLDEAERCAHVIVLHKGKVLAQGSPDEISQIAANHVYMIEPPPGSTPRGLQTRLLNYREVADAVPEAGRVRVISASPENKWLSPITTSIHLARPRLEDGFMILLHSVAPERPIVAMAIDRPPHVHGALVVVEVVDLVRRFGSFTAVDHVNFKVRRGEIFGLLGPNGAGKTTTFRMLCGLLAATHGTLRVAGVDLARARAAARERLGYVAQKFSLYGNLSVVENLEFFASAYGLRGDRRHQRIAWALAQFDLEEVTRLKSSLLPGGFKQRLAMAAALLHEPEILFLDEPTSGADPFARREFWRRITALAEQEVTVIVTTHFMEEAEYCDHVVILDHGRVLARGSPAEIRGQAHVNSRREPTMEDAFIAIVEKSRGNQTETAVETRATA